MTIIREHDSLSLIIILMIDLENNDLWNDRVKTNKTKKVTQTSIRQIIQNFIESTEWFSDIPLAVTTQGKKAIRFFPKNREVYQMDNFKVVEQINKLIAKGKITYVDLGEGKYEVTMLCGNKKIKMYFPADTNLSDHTEKYPDWYKRGSISKKETSRGKLWSEEWKKYLEQQEKLNKKLPTKKEFFELTKSLYPRWSEEKRILAFMLATGANGYIRLSDVNKEKNYQLAIQCSMFSYDRDIQEIEDDEDTSQLIFSTIS